ncbi:MAG: hypothetical protein OEY50_11595, partial [Nitrospinota bacterium]|nr:hypothetical protein [Nitrospinota bacterium]
EAEIYLKEAKNYSQMVVDELNPKLAAGKWAHAAMNLGSVLCRLGEITAGDEGVLWLHESTTLFKKAILIFKMEPDSMMWAQSNSCMANALSIMGERIGGQAGRAKLMDALQYYAASLKVRKMEIAPQQWGLTQLGLGNTYLRIARMEQDAQAMANSSLAMSAFDNALAAIDDNLTQIRETAIRGRISAVKLRMERNLES